MPARLDELHSVVGVAKVGTVRFTYNGLNRSRVGAAASGMAVPAMDGTMGATYLTMRARSMSKTDERSA